MKRILTSSILLLAFLATASAQPLKQSEITTHSVQSAILGEEVAYNIYLPKGYDATTPERYPQTGWVFSGICNTLSIRGDGYTWTVIQVSASGTLR